MILRTKVVPDELKDAARSGKHFLWSLVIFSFFVNVLNLTGPLFMLQIYDRVLASRSEATLLVLFLLVAFLFACMGMLEFARGRLAARYGARVQEKLDRRAMEVALLKALNPVERNGSAIGLRELESIQSFFASPMAATIFDAPWTPIYFAALFFIHPWLGWFAIAGAVSVLLVTWFNEVTTKAKSKEADSISQKAGVFADESRRGVEVLRSQGMQGTMVSRWLELRETSQRLVMAASDYSTIFSSFTKVWRQFLQSTVLALGAYLVLASEMSPGLMIAGSILLGKALAPIEQAIGQWKLIQRTIQSWTVLAQLFANLPKEPEKTPLPRPVSALQVQNLSVWAPKAQRPVLSGLSFSIEPGKALGIIGPTGSGKSSLARTLVGIWPPASGSLRLGGATIDQYDTDTFGGLIGYLPQEPILFTGSVTENIARMSKKPDTEQVMRAAMAANAHEMILGLPDGYDTALSGQHSILSGGQRQRVALARALYGDPVFLVLDEPNSALDAEGSEALNAAIHSFKAKGGCAVIMTHRPIALSECEDLLVIQGGRVVAQGPRDQVLRSFLRNPQATNTPSEKLA